MEPRGWPDVVCLCEVGAPLKGCWLDARYHRVYTDQPKNQLNCCVILKKGTRSRFVSLKKHDGRRGIYVEGNVRGIGCWILCLYVPSGPGERMAEVRELFGWATSMVAVRPGDAIGLVFGDWNCNPGWSPAPVGANTEACDIITEFCSVACVDRVVPDGDPPTWFGAGGVARHLDQLIWTSNAYPPRFLRSGGEPSLPTGQLNI